MSEGMICKIRVPASTANLGPGFDSVGLALSLYLTVEVYESDRWSVKGLSEEMRSFPEDETNYIVQVAKRTASRYGVELPPCRMVVDSEIPLARGLGSSASAIVAGIQIADTVGNLNLGTQEKVHLASLEEGHPDNAGASVTGGLVVGEHNEEETSLLSFPLPGIEVIAVIPEYELLTSHSREVLPKEFAYSQSVKASAVANTFLAAILSGNYGMAGKMMSRDLFHQPYRSSLVPLLHQVEESAKCTGAFGVALSGAGPTVVCFAEKKHSVQVAEKLAAEFVDCEVKRLQVDSEGCTVTLQ